MDIDNLKNMLAHSYCDIYKIQDLQEFLDVKKTIKLLDDNKCIIDDTIWEYEGEDYLSLYAIAESTNI